MSGPRAREWFFTCFPSSPVSKLATSTRASPVQYSLRRRLSSSHGARNTCRTQGKRVIGTHGISRRRHQSLGRGGNTTNLKSEYVSMLSFYDCPRRQIEAVVV
eukprot:scaffold803_cov310-Pinguiococcus_pyrenoidosus.AAC.190